VQKQRQKFSIKSDRLAELAHFRHCDIHKTVANYGSVERAINNQSMPLIIRNVVRDSIGV